MEEEKEKKVKRKIRKKPIIAACLVVAALIYLFGDCIKLPQKKQEAITDPDFFPMEEYKEQLSAEQSDIKGMTKWDKFEAGLSMEDGADSDLDGLTDKEEIEKYHTDPAKVSTSGDFYSDGYKVANDMDLTKEYEYKDNLEFENNFCEEVNLTALGAKDFNVFVNDLTDSGMYNMPKDKDVLKEYSVSLFSGNFAIDLSKIKKAPDAKHVNVYVQADADEEAKAVKCDRDGDVITLKKEFEYDQHYVVYLVNEKPALFPSMDKAAITYGVLDEKGEPEHAYGIVCGCPLIPDSIKVYYVETKDKTTGEQAKKYLSDIAEGLVSEWWASDQHFSEDHIIATTKGKVDMLARLSKKLCPQLIPIFGKCKTEINSLDSYGVLYTYYVYDELGEIPNAGGESVDAGLEDNELMEKFPVYRSMMCYNRLPFPNFSSEISPGGLCAGMAHLTTMVHNRGTVLDPAKDFKFRDTVYSYDLTKDPENKTLLDKGLNDYKDENFVKKHEDDNGLVTKDLSDGEKAFVDMVGYYWAKLNSSKGDWKYYIGSDVSYEDNEAVRLDYDGTVVRNIAKELDKGNYVDACFSLNTGGGHAVTITGYTKVKSDAEGYIFYVYDSNFPTKTGTVTCIVNKMKVGDGEYLDYVFKVPGAKYAAYPSTGTYGNEKGERIASFIALDTDYNILNEKQSKKSKK